MKKPVFEVLQKPAENNQWHWKLKGSNGAELAMSPRYYSRRRDCERALESVFLAIFDAGQTP